MWLDQAAKRFLGLVLLFDLCDMILINVLIFGIISHTSDTSTNSVHSIV